MVTVRIDQGYQNDLLKQISENFDEFNVKEQRPTQLILQILKVQSLKVRHIFFEIFGQRNPLKTQSLLVNVELKGALDLLNMFLNFNIHTHL